MKDQNQNGLKGADVPQDATGANDKLTEKQLRKLEWEKKLAEQKKGSTDETEAVSKAALKAKRREQQEAQRQAKEVKVTVKHQPLAKSSGKLASVTSDKDAKLPAAPEAKKLPTQNNSRLKNPSRKHVKLVQHLYSSPNPEYLSKLVNFRGVHPIFVKLGVRYSDRVILGSNARCLALLGAIKTLIEDIEAPPTQDFCRHAEEMLQSCTNYLQVCTSPNNCSNIFSFLCGI